MCSGSARVVSPESLKAKCVPQLTTAIGVRCQSQSQGGAGQQHKPDLDKCIFVVCPKKNRNFEHSFSIVEGKGTNQF